jgi:hypothetical protein
MEVLHVNGRIITKWFRNLVRVYTGFINIRKGTFGDSSEQGIECLERKYNGHS